MRRKILVALAVLVAVWIGFNAAMFAAMNRPPAEFGAFMKHVPMPLMMVTAFPPMWKHARAGRLNPGDNAPDFELPTTDKKGSVRLSAHRNERPVVLIFGSYT